MLITAQQTEGRRFCRLERGYPRQQFRHVGHRFSSDCRDHVAWPDAGQRRRAVLQHASDDHAGARFDPKGLRQFGRQFIRLHANPAPGHLAILHDAFQHQVGGSDGNRKTDAHIAART